MIKKDDFFNEINEGWKENADKEKQEIYNAFSFAKKAHEGQKRNEGTEYISHIIGALKIIKDEFEIDDSLDLVVTILHDVIEDTKYTYDDIKGLFGQMIADSVNVLTKKQGQSIDEYVEGIRNFPYYHQVGVIKLADRLHNLRSLLNIPNKKDKIIRKVEETKKYYLPMSQEIGEDFIYNKLVKAINDLEMVLDNE